MIEQCCNFHGINSTVEISWDIFRILAITAYVILLIIWQCTWLHSNVVSILEIRKNDNFIFCEHILLNTSSLSSICVSGMIFSNFRQGASSSWWYGSWIYNCMCSQCLSPLKMRVRTGSVLLVEETVVPRETHRPAASHWQTLIT
jgi:hypothetical protein